MNENNDNTMNSRNKYNCIPVVFLHGPFAAVVYFRFTGHQRVRSLHQSIAHCWRTVGDLDQGHSKHQMFTVAFSLCDGVCQFEEGGGEMRANRNRKVKGI